MRLALLVISAFACVAPTIARADCPARSVCVCSSSRTVVDGRIISVSDDRAELRVDAVEGDGSVVTVGATITISRGNVDKDERWLASYSGPRSQWPVPDERPEWRPMVEVDDGLIECRLAPDLELSASDALAMSIATNCDALFEARASAQKIGPQDCDDTLIGCSSTGLASVLALLPLIVRRRRKR